MKCGAGALQIRAGSLGVPGPLSFLVPKSAPPGRKYTWAQGAPGSRVAAFHPQSWAIQIGPVAWVRQRPHPQPDCVCTRPIPPSTAEGTIVTEHEARTCTVNFRTEHLRAGSPILERQLNSRSRPSTRYFRLGRFTSETASAARMTMCPLKM